MYQGSEGYVKGVKGVVGSEKYIKWVKDVSRE